MSWESNTWVMERSTQHGLTLFVFLVLSNDMNATGVGFGPPVKRMARRLRIDHRTVMRALRRIERSGELVCRVRGTGQTPTLWEIPGVVRDGFSLGSRGGKLPPQGRRIALPREAKRPPREGELPPTPILPTSDKVCSVNQSMSLPTTSAPRASVSTQNTPEKTPEELIQRLGEPPFRLDPTGVARLWRECRAQEPGVTVEKILHLAEWKCRTAPRVKNLGGLLITVLPDICRHDALYPKRGA